MVKHLNKKKNVREPNNFGSLSNGCTSGSACELALVSFLPKLLASLEDLVDPGMPTLLLSFLCWIKHHDLLDKIKDGHVELQRACSKYDPFLWDEAVKWMKCYPRWRLESPAKCQMRNRWKIPCNPCNHFQCECSIKKYFYNECLFMLYDIVNFTRTR